MWLMSCSRSGLALRALAVVSSVVLAISPVIGLAGSPASGQKEAERLVRLAQEAELGGDNHQRHAHLSQALQVRPNHELARWLSGHVRVEDNWLPLDQAEQHAAQDEGRKRYLQTRAATFERLPNKLQAHLVMARWCRQYRQEIEERYHWYKSLELAPHNPEALAGLKAVWYGGQLVPKEELERHLQECHRLKRRLKIWQRRLDRWLTQIHRRDDAKSAQTAMEELRSVTDREAIPVLLKRLSQGDAALGGELVRILDRMACPDATLALAWLAVAADQEALRAGATGRLRDKPLHDFVPQLLAAMQPLVNSSYDVTVNQLGNVAYEHEFVRKTAESDQKMTVARDFSQLDGLLVPGQMVASTERLGGTGPRYCFVVSPRTLPEYAVLRSRNAALAANNYEQLAQSIEENLEHTNALAKKTNARICAVLADVSGENLGDALDAWCSWWDEYNELHCQDPPKREERHHTERDVYVIPPKVIPVIDRTFALPIVVDEIPGIQMEHKPVPPKGGPTQFAFVSNDPRIAIKVSCFIRGTMVKTREGSRPIEQIQAGDLVLSQDVETGELDYRPVLTTTIRPPSSLRRIRLADEVITATAGHPFWVTGTGWRMAKLLKPGDRIHRLDGSTEVVAVESPPDEETINLIVGDFHTYFVGQQALLAHDGQLRRPTAAILPGYRP